MAQASGYGHPAPRNRRAKAREAGDTPTNMRAVLRAGAAFFMRTIQSLAQMLGGDLRKALVFHAMWTANVKHITSSAANLEFGLLDQPPPDDLLRPITVQALSQSLRIPYETVRRHVERLMDEGLCSRVGGKGVKIPATFLNSQPDRIERVRQNLPSLLQFLDDLKRAGFDFAPYRRPLPVTVPQAGLGERMPNARAVMRVGSEFLMRCVDVLGQMHDDDFQAGLVFTGIWMANIRPILGTAADLKYGGLEDLPPDELRQPVSIKALSESLGIPFETTRRHVNRLLRAGSVVRIADRGLVVPRKAMTSARQFRGVRIMHQHVVRLVADLHRAGFDFSAY